MSEPVPEPADLEPAQSAVLRALQQSLRSGDVAAVARWQARADELGIPASARAVDAEPTS